MLPNPEPRTPNPETEEQLAARVDSDIVRALAEEREAEGARAAAAERKVAALEEMLRAQKQDLAEVRNDSALQPLNDSLI
jgi:hypothetical protein